MRQAIIVLTASALGAFTFSQTADAGRVRVSEDAGAGFVVQGFVEVFDQSGSTAASLYSYGSPCVVSYSGTVITPQIDKTTLAVIDTSEGRTLFVVHDIPNVNAGSEPGCPYAATGDSTGGASDNVYDLSYDPDGMGCLVRDDDPGNDTYSSCAAGNTSISADHLWVSTRTDGVVLGTLEGAWQLDMSYVGAITNIAEVVVLDGNMTANVTGLTPGNTVRLDNVLEVDIDIKPGSDPNCFNINDHGIVPVAIFGSAEFDVSEIDPATLVFGGLVVRVRGNGNPQCSIKDSDGDGIDDLVCQFEDNSEAWVPGDGTAELSGELTDGTPFYGEDAICVRPSEG